MVSRTENQEEQKGAQFLVVAALLWFTTQDIAES